MTSNTVIGGAVVDALDLLQRVGQRRVVHQRAGERMRSLKWTRCGEV